MLGDMRAERKEGMCRLGVVRRGCSVSMIMTFLWCSDEIWESFRWRTSGLRLKAWRNVSTFAGLRSVSNETKMT